MARPRKEAKALPKGIDPELLKLLHKQSNVLGKKFDTSPVSLSKGGYVKGAISFGSLAIDLVSGGGIPPGRMTTISGPSMSGKSTLLYQGTANANFAGIPTIYMDHESSADAKYLTALGIDIGEATDEGLFLYSTPVAGEDTYRHLAMILDVFPDKNTSEFMPPQALVCIDSFAAMIPEAQEEDPEKKMQMAAVAKVHAQGLPMIKVKMYKKNVAFIGTNQIRQKPGVVYGNPEYEPGGEALTFYADLKIKARGKGKPEMERHRELRQTNIEITKNKAFPPWLKIGDETPLKIAMGYGFDRFYDGLAFLKLTEQVEFVKGRGGGWKITGMNSYAPLEGKLLDINDLVVELFKNDFRQACLKQMHDGSAFERLFAHLDFGALYKYDPEFAGVDKDGETGVDPAEADDIAGGLTSSTAADLASEFG